MKLLSRLLLPCAAVLFLGVGAAKADPASLLFFNLTGPVDATFELSSSPTPSFVDPGDGFNITPIGLTINGKPSKDFLTFYSDGFGPGFAAFSSSIADDFSLNSVAQLYGGTEQNPTFSPTTGVSLTDDAGAPYTLTIGKVTTPEPSSLFLLGMVLLPLGIAAKRLL